MKNVVQDLTSAGIDWQREKWKSGFGSKYIHQGEKNAVKYADEVIVLSKGVQDYFKETYGRETHFIPNGVNRPQIREASLITDKFGLKKDSYILFLGRLVPEKGIRYLVEAFKNVKTDKKLVIAGGSSDTDSFILKEKNVTLPSFYELELVFSHITTSANGCIDIRKHGLITHACQNNETELGAFLYENGVSIDLSRRELHYVDKIFDVSYDRCPPEYMETESMI